MKWTPEQKDKLKKLCYEGKTNKELAAIFNCEVSDIYAKRSQMGITRDKCKAAQKQTPAKLSPSKPSPDEAIEKAFKDLLISLHEAMTSNEITEKKIQVLSVTTALVTDTENLFHALVRKL